MNKGRSLFALPPALDPAGPFAAPLAEISIVMSALMLAIFAVALAALILALRGKSARFLATTRTVVIGGLIFPIVVLTAALAYGLSTTARLGEPPDPEDMRVRVIGEMWWWRILYLGEPAFETANELVIPVGRTVTLELQSSDVIHSFWAPQLGPKLDMIPGRTNILRIEADAPGVYRGQCTEYCGAAHALMAFRVIALEEGDFARWRARFASEAKPPIAAGAAMFDRAGCGACHAVRGTGATGQYGPDLTHVAARRTLAGILPNEPEILRRWIADADALKPGVRMPSYEVLSPAEIDAIADYLEALP